MPNIKSYQLELMAEHQQFSERALRLAEGVMNTDYCHVLPIGLINLIREMEKLALNGATAKTAIQSHYLNSSKFSPESIYPENEIKACPSLKIGSVVCVDDAQVRRRLIVNKDQRFRVEAILPDERIKVKCILQHASWDKFNHEFIAHYSLFSEIH